MFPAAFLVKGFTGTGRRCRCQGQLGVNGFAGINQWDVDVPPRYLSNTHLAARVGGLNPRWNEDASSERADAQFQKAVQLTGSEFLECVHYLSKASTPTHVPEEPHW